MADRCGAGGEGGLLVLGGFPPARTNAPRRRRVGYATWALFALLAALGLLQASAGAQATATDSPPTVVTTVVRRPVPTTTPTTVPPASVDPGDIELPTTIEELKELADELKADLEAIADQIFTPTPTQPATGTSRPPTDFTTGTSRPPTDTTTGTSRPDLVICGAPATFPTPTTIRPPPAPPSTAPPTTFPPPTLPPPTTIPTVVNNDSLGTGGSALAGGSATAGTGSAAGSSGSAFGGTATTACEPDDDADAPAEPVVEVVTLAPVVIAPPPPAEPAPVAVPPVEPSVVEPIEEPPPPPEPAPSPPPPQPPPVLAFFVVTVPTVLGPVAPVTPIPLPVPVLDVAAPPEVSPRLIPPEVRPAPPPGARPLIVRGIGPGRPSALAGGLAEASGLDCPAGSTVTLRIEGRDVGRTTANATGGFQAQLALPSDLQTGRRQVSAICGPVTLDGQLQLVQTSSNLNAGAGITTLAALLSLFLLIVLLLRNTQDDRRSLR